MGKSDLTGALKRNGFVFTDAETKDEQPTERLNAEIPTGLHERFKSPCRAEGQGMTDVLTQLVETYVELMGNE